MQKLSNAGIRVKADLRNEKIGFKIREHTLRRVPYMLVCGDKEVESGKVAVRTRRGKDLGSMDVNEVIPEAATRDSQPAVLNNWRSKVLGGKRVQTARPNRINGEIRAQEVRLTGLEGEQLGIVKNREKLWRKQKKPE